jgi:hypothetical protein
MKSGFLSALIVLVAIQGVAFAQQYGPDPIGPWGDRSAGAVVHGDPEAGASTFCLWGSAEYLLWWIKDGRVPPLVTAGGNGKLGSPGTRILVDNLDFNDNARDGGRFPSATTSRGLLLCVEANCFFLANQQSDESFSPAATRFWHDRSPISPPAGLMPR